MAVGTARMVVVDSLKQHKQIQVAPSEIGFACLHLREHLGFFVIHGETHRRTALSISSSTFARTLRSLTS